MSANGEPNDGSTPNTPRPPSVFEGSRDGGSRASYASSGRAPKLAIATVEGQEVTLDLRSPRTMEAVKRQGLENHELMPKPYSAFFERGSPAKLQKVRQAHYEEKRVEKIQAVIYQRQIIIHELEAEGIAPEDINKPVGLTPTQRGKGMKAAPVEDNGILERERARMEKTRKMQQREIEQMLEYEVKMEKYRQDAIARQEKDAERLAERKRYLAKKKAEANEMKRQQDLRRKQELEEEEKRRKEVQQKMYIEARKRKEREAQLERERKKDAIKKEKEREQKSAEHKAKVAAMNRQFMQRVHARDAEIQEKERIRQENLEIKRREELEKKKREREEKMRKIHEAQRISDAIQEKKRHDFWEKEAREEWRRKNLPGPILQAIEEKKKRRQQKTQHLQRTFQEAARREVDRIRSIHMKKAEQEDKMRAQREEREQEEMIRWERKRLEKQDKKERAARLAKMEEYNKRLMIRKIEEDNMKSEMIKWEREQIQKQRLKDRLKATVEKAKVVSAFEQVKKTGQWKKLAAVTGKMPDLASGSSSVPASPKKAWNTPRGESPGPETLNLDENNNQQQNNATPQPPTGPPPDKGARRPRSVAASNAALQSEKFDPSQEATVK